MPSGKIKWYEPSKGFGFIAGEDGEEVYVHASALPQGVESMRPGTKVEFGVADGRRGPQALAVTILESAPSVARAKRRPAEDTAQVLEDLIKVLERTADGLRHGRYPEPASGKRVAEAMRRLADELEA
ncbi:cold shock domain-containing protein [Galactobacter caseinivorans]|uniref:Cold-shock protein n=1 Tax=Galactobacter caseinivorans TaxID=2676123 RepID=A0A496PFE9_9MICC|nr:cold shock domain-containing protein [Galactobacter caseinivorans]RKW69442.1 cold-shock protein [Galactobacter caseinivorans]